MCYAPGRRWEGPFHLYEWSGRSVRHIKGFCKIMRPSARCARRIQTHGAHILLLLMLLFSAGDKQVHAQYVDTYQQADRTGALRIMTATHRACFQGLIVIRNLAAHPHKHSSDYKKRWVAMCCFGDFTGGELVIPLLKMMFKFEPGDMIFFMWTLLEHYVLPFTGHRTSLVFFTHHNIMN